MDAIQLYLLSSAACIYLGAVLAAFYFRDKAGAMARGQIEKATAETRAELASARREADSALAEMARVRSAPLIDSEELSAKDAEIHRLKDRLAVILAQQELSEQKLAEFKKIGADASFLDGELEELKRSSHDMKRRIEESRMRMRLLNEKAKENVELMAGFAAGKEFDEFRKSIHLNELIQKYEDEIKELRIKNMDLERRAGGAE